MFPILVTIYVKLERREKREVLSEFGNTYEALFRIHAGFFPEAQRQVFAWLTPAIVFVLFFRISN